MRLAKKMVRVIDRRIVYHFVTNRVISGTCRIIYNSLCDMRDELDRNNTRYAPEEWTVLIDTIYQLYRWVSLVETGFYGFMDFTSEGWCAEIEEVRSKKLMDFLEMLYDIAEEDDLVHTC